MMFLSLQVGLVAVRLIIGASATPDRSGGAASPWLTERTVLAAFALCVLFPLCLQRHMRQLERAAALGVVMVAVLIGAPAASIFVDTLSK